MLSAAPKQGSDQQLTGLTFELEDAAIHIEPANLYNDIDLSIDPAERLAYSFLTENLPFTLIPTISASAGTPMGSACKPLGVVQLGSNQLWLMPRANRLL